MSTFYSSQYHKLDQVLVIILGRKRKWILGVGERAVVYNLGHTAGEEVTCPLFIHLNIINWTRSSIKIWGGKRKWMLGVGGWAVVYN